MELDLFVAIYLFALMAVMGVFCVIAYNKRKKRGDFMKNEKGEVVLTPEAEREEYGESVVK